MKYFKSLLPAVLLARGVLGNSALTPDKVEADIQEDKCVSI